MRIYLVGYMGSGKSTLGRKLSEEMDIQFIDMDDYIEERNHKTIPQIFAEEGENAFREKERMALEELSEFTDVVVATGGGAPCFFDNMELMKKSGITIFLNIDPDILAERLLDSKIDRPLIRGKSREELTAFINESLQKRLPFYKKAHLQLIKPDADTAELKEQLLNLRK
ncbi:MAG: shikimate kinase [Chlorobi bacterium]|nr:shikimate kinase [Chlorobiota bacterium]